MKVKPAEIVIVGGGIIGLTIARALALQGVRDICLIEKGDLGTESSFAAAGMLAPQVEADTDDEFFRLACQSRDMYPDFAAALLDETNIDIELDTTGTLYLALSENEEMDCHHRYSWQIKARLDVVRLSSADVRELEPAVNPAVRTALLFPNDIQVENRRLICALIESIKQLGVQLVTDSAVEELFVDRNRTVGIKTANGFISCSKVVLCAGAWTNFIRIAANDTRTRNISLPLIEPVRGQMVCFTAKPQLTRHVVYSARGYIVPRHDGRLLAGSTSEPAGFAKQVTAEGLGSILQRAVEISPAISHLPVATFWAGLRPKAADGLPVLGPCDEIDGLFYATGHYRNGILLAPITGDLIARLILNERVSPSVQFFSPNRFHQTAVGAS